MLTEYRIQKKIRLIMKRLKKLEDKSDEAKNLRVKLRTLERALIIIQEPL